MRCVLILSAAALLAACTSTPYTPKPDDPAYAPVMPGPGQEQLEPNGAIFQDNYANSLYSDIKAHRVGDIITVELAESTQAQKRATTQQAKDGSLNINPLNIGGQPINVAGYPVTASMSSNNEFDGQANTNQSNSLQGSITVSVARVLPNGNLMVQGEKWLMLNTGEEYVRISGMIRPEDISADNRVESTRVANARIYYGGTGDFANTQSRGWLAKFFNSPWFPF
ncbi:MULTISPECIES: flagellar basal body L-ring protein FlgH [Oceanimonas]|uniref:Flagellar L-ring protein n=1 Tax=Oceanimonas doudoroffii TaxID=84158 RepID=A0A233RIR9_9GAMM|nr:MULTISPECIES: flagellar basal body L-ring protein FlgH [Oceanimonas]NHI00122.1 Flagellar L-ring protein [Oceanimonas sp. MB9]OXY83281.1 flagellar basal body L-ring protein [Oceanimonas doudoroffii]